MKTTQITVFYGPTFRRMVDIPKNWIVIMTDKVKKGDKYWNYNLHKFVQVSKKEVKKRVSRYGLLIRRMRSAA